MKMINNQDLVTLTNTKLLYQDNFNQFIYLNQVPQHFGLGKNSFLVGIKEGQFQPNTTLNIFFIDSKNQSKPVVVTQYKEKTYIRCYVQINQSDNNGFGTLVICGTLKTLNKMLVSSQWQNKLNIKLQKKIYVNTSQKTQSGLRFKNKPTITAELNIKDLQQFQIQTLTQKLNILPLTRATQNIISNGKQFKKQQFLKIPIDTQSSINTVYYQKFFNYNIVDNFEDAFGIDNYNKIFSGSTESGYFPEGNYYGTLMVKQDANIVVTNIDGILQKAQLNLSGCSPSIDRLYCQNVNQFVTEFGQLKTKNEDIFKYTLFLKGDSVDFSNLQLKDSNSLIRPTIFNGHIQTASMVTFNTNYFSGSIVSGSGNYFVQQFQIETGSGMPVYGKKTNRLIKDNKRFNSEIINQNQLYDQPYIMSGSCNLLSTGYTKFNNCFLQDFKFQNNIQNNPITFNYLKGTIYTKNYNSVLGSTQSYFSGSLQGKGTFTVTQSGRVIFQDNSYIDYEDDDQVQLNDKQIFTGKAYNVLATVQRLSGQIYLGTLTSNNLDFNTVYTQSIQYKQVYLQSCRFNIDVNNLDILQINTPLYMTPPTTFKIKLQEKNSFINLKSSGVININSLIDDYNIEFNGYFKFKQNIQNAMHKFTGSYQTTFTNQFSQLQMYDIQTSHLTPQYQKILNTNEIYFNNNDYTNLYLPISVNSKNIDYDKLYQKFYDPNQQDYKIQLKYSFKNKFKKGKPIGQKNNYPLTITIDEIQIYSGKYGSIQVYYSNQYPSKNYQLLTILQIDEEVYPIVKKIDLPSMAFSGQTINLQFRHKDINGNYSPQQFFNYIYDIKLDTQQLLSVNKTYNTSYIGQNFVSGVYSVNNKTGVVLLRAEDIPYKNSDVYAALNQLYQNQGGSGTYNWIINSINPQQYSAVRYNDMEKLVFEWQSNPLVTIGSYNYTVSIKPYPFENYQNWVDVESGSLPKYSTIFNYDSETNSIKFELTAKTNQNEIATITQYKYKSNYIGAWNSIKEDSQGDMFVYLESDADMLLQQTYQTQYTVDAGVDEYIYISHPSRLQPPPNENQIYFQVNGFVGGFTKLNLAAKITNIYGFEQEYNCYKSVNSNLGLTHIKVKNYYI